MKEAPVRSGAIEEAQMPTTFAVTTFALLTTLNNAGQLALPDKSELPPGILGPVFWSEQACNWARGRADHPEKFVCAVFTGPKSTPWVYVAPGSVIPTAEPEPPPPERKSSLTPKGESEAEPSKKALDDIQVSKPDKLGDTDKPPVPEQAPKPKRVAQQPRYEQQAMFTGNPFSALFNW
jgi:hypothetical protein